MHTTEKLRQQRSVVAIFWLLLGSALLVLTPLPVHTAALGWAPALWLVGAPLALLLVLQPRLPMHLLATALQRRRAPRRRAFR